MNLQGIFDESRYNAHKVARTRTLATPGFSSRVISPIPAPAKGKALQDAILDALHDDHFVFFKLDHPLSDLEYFRLASFIGRPMNEDPEEISSFVRQGCILEVKERFNKETSVDMQPFSRAAVLVHTENSRSPLGEQPRYIAFQCITHMGEDSPTLMFSMDEVLRSLSGQDITILEHTYYPNLVGRMPILRCDETYGRVFSFRDFGGSNLEWVNDFPEIDDHAVNKALENLLNAIYSSRPLAVNWEPNTLFVFDNFKFFHGKPESFDRPFTISL